MSYTLSTVGGEIFYAPDNIAVPYLVYAIFSPVPYGDTMDLQSYLVNTVQA